MLRKSIFSLQKRFSSTLKKKLDEKIRLREEMGIVPEILNYKEVEELCKELQNPKDKEIPFLLNQFTQRIVPGVDDTSRLKANFLLDFCLQKINCPVITEYDAIKILGTMQGGYNIEALIQLLENKNENFAKLSSNELKKIF